MLRMMNPCTWTMTSSSKTYSQSITEMKGKAMAKPTLQDYEFFCCEDGIYFGRALKNGSLSKDARKVTNEEIVNMFSEFLQGYCLTHNKPLELMKNGKPFLQATIII